MSDERFIPGTSRITEIESFHRYLAAADLCHGKKVLDIASGEGYGSDILSKTAREVVGVDICESAVDQARKKYVSGNLTFACGDAYSIPFPDGTFDCAVSFETIEHLEQPDRLLAEIKRVLAPDGFLILSSPNKKAFDRRNHCENGENIYHKKEMENAELIALAKQFFQNIEVFSQDSFFNSLITGQNSVMHYFVKDGNNKIIRHESLYQTQYSIVLAGNGDLPSLQPSTYLDAHFDEQFGYQPDDEAIVNQFGLRGQFEQISAELAEKKGQLERLHDLVFSLGKDLDDEKNAYQNDRDIFTDTVHRIDMLRVSESLLSDNLKTCKIALEQAGKELDFLRETVKDKNIELHNAQDYLSTIESQYNVICSTAAALRDDLNSTRQKLNSSELALQECRKELSSAENEISSLRGQITDQDSLNAKIAELSRDLTEEQARSQYFRTQFETLQSAWSLRIFGRFNVRKRFHGAVQALKQSGRWIAGKLIKQLIFDNLRNAAQGLRENGHRTAHNFSLFRFHLWEKSLNWRLIPYDKQVTLIHSEYERLGTLLKDEQEYQDWQRRQKFDFYQKLKSGAWLVVPEDLPLTSIIIPVYNHLKFTLSCLHSIYSINSKAPFEVIVVDDCSKENYSVLRRHFPQVKLVRNQKNLGFLQSANRGAKEAKGEYIVFLNNDTEVLPAWLDELASALYHHQEAGMIGSQLIHMRTGTLQESGNLICKDGSMIPLGRGIDPNHPAYTFFKEVDFVSAASIILRKKVFDEMNGFDLNYAPAYFEDPDLGLRLQKAGYHNYVMPLSRVLHYEMVSYGNTLEDACEKNRQYFFSCWKDYLAKHALYDNLQDFADNRKFSHDRLLYIDAETPMADRGSGGMDAIFFMEYFLKRGLDVVFHGEYTALGTPKYTEILLRMGVECINEPHRKIWKYLETMGWCFKWLFISRVYQAQCFDSLLKRFCSQAHYIFNTVDLHFIREKLEADLRNDPKLRRQAKWTKMFELAVAKNADATIVISQDEKRVLEQEYGMTNVWHIPQARIVVGRKENVKRKGAVFVGSAHPPNMDGLRYFHDEILPLLPSDFQLTIVGEALRNVMSQKPEYQDLLQCPQFKFVGFVEDLGEVFNTAQLSIAPLRYGAGTKGKVASSMSFGLPCVSTNFGVEGTGMTAGKNIMLGRTPQEFADAIRQLCTDPVLWRKISDGGLEFLRSKYDPAQVAAEVDKIFDFIIEKYKRSPKKHGDWAQTMVLPRQEELDAVALE